MVRIGVTEILFGCELLFTGLKALALLPKNKRIRCFVAVPCFVTESVLGLALSILLLLVACRALNPVVSVLGVYILTVELMSVASEGTCIWLKIRERSLKLNERQWWRAAINWFAFSRSICAVCMHIWILCSHCQACYLYITSA